MANLKIKFESHSVNNLPNFDPVIDLKQYI